MEYYIGEIIPFAGTFAPVESVDCDGRLLSINDYQALFAVIGTTYGGDGMTNFAVPDLRGRIPIGDTGSANPPGWTQAVPMGMTTGVESVTLVEAQMPAHNHLMMGSTSQATQSTIGNGANVLASTASNVLPYGDLTKPVANTRNLSPKALALAGGSQPHSNVMPTASVRYVICTAGYFPSFS